MTKPSRAVRRRFLKSALAMSLPGFSCARRKSAWRFFTEEEAATVAAITDRLIPPDQDPAASALGVVTYIDRQLARRFKENQAEYRKGLEYVEELARRKHDRGFIELAAADQDALLSEVEKGEQRAWFDLVWNHTMQGYYGSPRHGGNRDGASWTMLGIPDPPVRGRHHNDFSA